MSAVGHPKFSKGLILLLVFYHFRRSVTIIELLDLFKNISLAKFESPFGEKFQLTFSPLLL